MEDKIKGWTGKIFVDEAASIDQATWDSIVTKGKEKKSVVATQFFSGMFEPTQFWFRFFGIGLTARNIKVHPLVFSERYGYRKYWRVGLWVFSYLHWDIRQHLRPSWW